MKSLELFFVVTPPPPEALTPRALRLALLGLALLFVSFLLSLAMIMEWKSVDMISAFAAFLAAVAGATLSYLGLIGLYHRGRAGAI